MPRILIVDDDPQGLYMLETLLIGHGHQVETAVNGAEALEKARRNPPEMIISDFFMPTMDGFALCRQCKEDAGLKEVPFIAYTATYTDPRDEELALSLGAARFLIKPIEPDVLLREVNQVFADSSAGRLPICEPACDQQMREYNEALIRKLEAKVLQLQETNLALQEEMARRQQAQEAQRKSEERYHQIAMCIPDMIWIVDLSGRFIYANEAVARTHGYTIEEFLTLSYQDVCTPEQAIRHATMITEELANAATPGFNRDQVRRFETQEVRKDGSRFVAEVSATFLWSKNNEPVGIIGITRDITDRKQAEDALRESEERYRTFFELGAVGMAKWDPTTGRLFRVNDRMCEITGYSREELYSIPVGNLTHPDDRQSDSEKFSAMVRGEIPEYDNEKRYVRKNGNVIWVQVAARVIRGAAGEPLRTVAVILDITERKRAEDALKGLNTELEQKVAQRTALAETRTAQLRELAAKLTQTEQKERRRIAHILHEHLQQLLFAAKLRLEYLRGKLDNVLAHSVDEAEHILSEGIEASRSLAIELYPPVLYSLGLLPALSWLATRMKNKYGLEVDLVVDPESEPATDALRTLLFDSTAELLFNVVKHAGVKAATVRARRLGDQVGITVSDKGVGFEVAQLPMQTGTAGAFGLFSIREKVDLVGGRLEIETAPGRGSRFTIITPLDQTSESHSLTASSAIAAIAAEIPEGLQARDTHEGGSSSTPKL